MCDKKRVKLCSYVWKFSIPFMEKKIENIKLVGFLDGIIYVAQSKHIAIGCKEWKEQHFEKKFFICEFLFYFCK